MILATRNPHKLAEFARLLGSLRLEPLPDGVDLGPETGEITCPVQNGSCSLTPRVLEALPTKFVCNSSRALSRE